MIKAWHFVADTLRDGRPIPKDGVWLKHDGELKLCKQGLHASRQILDALIYAPGHTLCRVSIQGRVQEDTDKLVASERRIEWRIDVEAPLRAFARWCAIQVLDAWKAPEIVRKWLRTGDPTARSAAYSAAYSAASSALYSAAHSAAYSTAYSAASSAARSTAYSVARSAARSAASSAASSAAYSAAYSAARSKQEKALLQFIREARQGYTSWEFTDV